MTTLFYNINMTQNGAQGLTSDQKFGKLYRWQCITNVSYIRAAIFALIRAQDIIVLRYLYVSLWIGKLYDYFVQVW